MNDKNERMRQLTKALFFSGACNIVLLCLLLYWIIRDRPPAPYYELKPAEKKEQQAPLAIDRSNAEVLRLFRPLPKDQLAAKLNNAQLVENGYTQRDLALACLIQFHHFDLNRALAGQPWVEQQRTLVYGRHQDGSLAEINVYPGLSDSQFQAIISFINTEKWPLTGKGLFLLLSHHLKKKESPDTTLIDAFYLAPEFLAVEMLFSRSDASVDKTELLQLLSEGDWEMLSRFAEQQRIAQDLSPARRQKFLLNYIEHGSNSAAYLILKTDGQFAARKLDDGNILRMLGMLIDKTPEAEQFALSQLMSPRGDAVWKMAAQRLYDYAGETPPEKYHHHAALARFVKKNSIITIANQPPPVIVPPIKPKPVSNLPSSKQKKTTPGRGVRYYVVQDGDSLWKISRLYKVDIDKLKNFNQLQSDSLKPGTTLRIPIN